jgi:hypothetical protein
MPLPGIKDFIPYASNPADSPDQFCAWKNLGGKTLEEVCEMMLSNPLTYQEDFMWMGAPAFKFYFPAIDRYLRSLPVATEDDSTEARILSACIQMHFDCHEDMRGIHEQVISLCDYVTSHSENMDFDGARREEIRVRWSGLRQRVLDDSHGIAGVDLPDAGS